MKTLKLLAPLALALASTTAHAETTQLPVGRDLISCAAARGPFVLCTGTGAATLGSVPVGSTHPELVDQPMDLKIDVTGQFTNVDEIVVLRVGNHDLALHDGANPSFSFVDVAPAGALSVSVSTLLDGNPQLLDKGAQASIQTISVRVTPTLATLATWKGDAKDAAGLLRALMDSYDSAKLLRDIAVFTGESSASLRALVVNRINLLENSGRGGTELVVLKTVLANIDATTAGNPSPVLGILEDNIVARRAEVQTEISAGEPRLAILDTWKADLAADVETVRADLEGILKKARDLK